MWGRFLVGVSSVRVVDAGSRQHRLLISCCRRTSADATTIRNAFNGTVDEWNNMQASTDKEHDMLNSDKTDVWIQSLPSPGTKRKPTGSKPQVKENTTTQETVVVQLDFEQQLTISNNAAASLSNPVASRSGTTSSYRGDRLAELEEVCS